MANDKPTDAKIFTYEFEVAIDRNPADIWSLITDEIDSWWMPDFRALGETSRVSLDAKPGGLLTEETPDGGFLEWYRVQMCSPGKSLYLVGYLAPDWGGPTLSMLKLGIDASAGASLLTVSDALLGNVSKASSASAQSGWNTLFGDGLKTYAER
jgi:uncharacterized protein YndB with AHSA1/START domain